MAMAMAISALNTDFTQLKEEIGNGYGWDHPYTLIVIPYAYVYIHCLFCRYDTHVCPYIPWTIIMFWLQLIFLR